MTGAAQTGADTADADNRGAAESSERRRRGATLSSYLPPHDERVGCRRGYAS